MEQIKIIKTAIILILTILALSFNVVFNSKTEYCNVSILGHKYYGPRYNATLFWNKYVELDSKNKEFRIKNLSVQTETDLKNISKSELDYWLIRENYFNCN